MARWRFQFLWLLLPATGPFEQHQAYLPFADLAAFLVAFFLAITPPLLGVTTSGMLATLPKNRSHFLFRKRFPAAILGGAVRDDSRTTFLKMLSIVDGSPAAAALSAFIRPRRRL